MEGSLIGRTVIIENGITNEFVISGFNIRNGLTSNENYGGGIRAEDSSPKIINNIIEDNYSDGWHGKGLSIGLYNSSSIISNNTLLGDEAVIQYSDIKKGYDYR